MSVNSTAPLIRLYPKNTPAGIQINDNLIDVNYKTLPEIIYVEDTGNYRLDLSVQNNTIRAMDANNTGSFINAEFYLWQNSRLSHQWEHSG